MLDREFFMREFPLRVQRFSEERESLPVRVVLSTASGRDFDVHRLTTSNAGIALYAADVADSMAEGIERAREALASGRAKAKLQQFVARTQELS